MGAARARHEGGAGLLTGMKLDAGMSMRLHWGPGWKQGCVGDVAGDGASSH